MVIPISDKICEKDADNDSDLMVSKSLNIAQIYPKEPIIVYYDLTRLISRRKKPFATGIDRVDLEYLKQHIVHPQIDLRCISLTDDEVQLIQIDVIKKYIKALSSVWSGSRLVKDPCTVLKKNGNLQRSRFRRIKLKYFEKLRFSKSTFSKNESQKRYYFNASHIGVLSLKNKICEPFFKYIEATLITYVHDLIPLTHKSFSTKTASKKLKNYTSNALKFSSINFFNSLATQDEFYRYYKIKFHGAKSFVHYPVIKSNYSGSVRKSIKELSEGTYFLSVGTIEARKNHMMLLKIFQSFTQKNSSYLPPLIIVGKRGWKNDSTLDYLDEIKKKTDQIIEINDANDQEVKLLEKGALALLFPTFVEGFNLPLCDSLNSSIPKLVSDIRVHKEICNEFGGKKVTFLNSEMDVWEQEILKLAGIKKRYNRAFVPDCAAILPFGHNAKAVKYFTSYFDSVAHEVKPLVCREIAQDFIKFDEEAKKLPYLYSRRMIKNFIRPSFFSFNLNPVNSVFLRKLRKYIFKIIKYDIFECIILRTYKKIFKTYRVSNYDIFFFHSASYYSIFGILSILNKIDFDKWPKVHFRLINVLESANINNSGYTKLVGLLRETHSRHPNAFSKISISTETPRYTQKIISDTNYPASILPYPPIDNRNFEKETSYNYFSVGFLGSGREDKGFFRILNIIKIFLEKYNYHSISFLVQSIEEKTIQEDHNKMHYVSQLGAHPYINLLDSQLSEDHMNLNMCQCDILCLPYNKDIYRYRGSAMLMEALSDKKYVIASKGCGFSEFIPLLGNGAVVESDEDFADAIYEFLCNKPKCLENLKKAQLEHEKWFENSMKEVLK